MFSRRLQNQLKCSKNTNNTSDVGLTDISELEIDWQAHLTSFTYI